jgi:hypothetical protein
MELHDVAAIYQEQMAIMEAGARVRDFLPILVSGKVKELLGVARSSATKAARVEDL